MKNDQNTNYGTWIPVLVYTIIGTLPKVVYTKTGILPYNLK